MIRSISKYLTRSVIQAQNKTRKKQFLEWDQIKSIALIIDSSGINKSKLDEICTASGKYFEVFFIEIRSKNPSFSDWKCLLKKDKSLIGLPSKAVMDEFKKKKFDLCISLNKKGNLYTCYLTGIINAPFKCGLHDVDGELDLIVANEEGRSVEQDLAEVMRYLKMIKTQ